MSVCIIYSKDAVKIGTSRNVEARVRTLQTGSSEPSVLTGTMTKK